MREFKYKGATVRPYEPFNAHQTDGFSVGSLRGGGMSDLTSKQARFNNYNRR